MDKLAEAATAHLCRHRSVGLFRLTPGVGSQAQWRWWEARRTLRGRGWSRRSGDRQLDRSVDKPTPQSPTAKNGVLFRLFLVFAFARRRRTARRYYPTPCEM